MTGDKGAGRRLSQRSRELQGFPPEVSNLQVLRQIADVLRAAERRLSDAASSGGSGSSERASA